LAIFWRRLVLVFISSISKDGTHSFIIAGMEPIPFLVTVSEEEVRRERRKARELRASQWWKRKRSSGVCHHCGGKFPPANLTMDHLVPIIRGGKSTKGNVVASCKRCNSERKHRLPFEQPHD
jgi:5-methylcytosine-specific restriction endonuclease McrA